MGSVAGSAHVVRGADDFIPSGQYVSIVLGNVSPDIVEAYRVQGFVALFSLLPHENKLSVLHFTVERRDGYDEPIKSKEALTFQVGFRSFSARPIYSEINLNCDKHKMDRFFRKGCLNMASVFGPVTFLPCPLLVFKKHETTGAMILVATGALSAIDPDRIMLKKVILTGVPIRVRKRSAVVRQLFYDPQDVRWFKPAELVTKWGIRGHIKEPIGTHGLLKAQFGAPIKQNDTVMLILYKRMFPKFDDETSKKVVCY
jgi:pre-rRNA-processing protein TSR1